jgi:hypothetical protein
MDFYALFAIKNKKFVIENYHNLGKFHKNYQLLLNCQNIHTIHAIHTIHTILTIVLNNEQSGSAFTGSWAKNRPLNSHLQNFHLQKLRTAKLPSAKISVCNFSVCKLSAETGKLFKKFTEVDTYL